MDDKKALDTALGLRRRLNQRDVVSTMLRLALVKYLDDLVSLLAHRSAPEIVEQPAAPPSQLQFGIVQYPGNKLLEGPFHVEQVGSSYEKYSPESAMIVWRRGEKEPWQNLL